MGSLDGILGWDSWMGFFEGFWDRILGWDFWMGFLDGILGWDFEGKYEIGGR